MDELVGRFDLDIVGYWINFHPLNFQDKLTQNR
jgi:hypothetical protein